MAASLMRRRFAVVDFGLLRHDDVDASNSVKIDQRLRPTVTIMLFYILTLSTSD